MNPLPGHPDTETRPTLATHLFNDVRTAEVNERSINNHAKAKHSENPDLRVVKTPRRNPRANSLSRYGTWGYMMLGMLMCSIVLLMCGIWECIRRVQKTDVLEHFNGEPLEVMPPERDDDNNCPQYDPPPPYSSLFPLAKDFNSTTQSDSSAPSSIYFTASSATFLPSAPSAPASIEGQIPQITLRDRDSGDDHDNTTSSPA